MTEVRGRPPALFPLFASIDTLPGIGPKGRAALEQMGIDKPRDLILTLPTGLLFGRIAKKVGVNPRELAGWLAARLGVKVKRSPSAHAHGLSLVRLVRASGNVELARPDGRTARLTQPGQPERLIALARREVSDCLAEELRRLDPDEVYHEALLGLSQVTRGRTPVKV